MKWFTIGLPALVLLLGGSGQARADVIINNLIPPTNHHSFSPHVGQSFSDGPDSYTLNDVSILVASVYTPVTPGLDLETVSWDYTPSTSDNTADGPRMLNPVVTPATAAVHKSSTFYMSGLAAVGMSLIGWRKRKRAAPVTAS